MSTKYYHACYNASNFIPSICIIRVMYPPIFSSALVIEALRGLLVVAAYYLLVLTRSISKKA